MKREIRVGERLNNFGLRAPLRGLRTPCTRASHPLHSGFAPKLRSTLKRI